MSPRSSQRGDRRRRVLADESRNEAAITTPRIFRGDSEGPAQRYNHAALQAINAPIAKYIPLRPFYLLIWLLVGLIPVMGLLLLDMQLPQISAVVGVAGARPFDLDAAGNLVAWSSSVSLGFAVALMLGIYSVRRHRRDDYRGHFTVWRWAISCAVLASVDATVGLHHAWQGLCEFATKTSLLGDGSIWWLAPWTILFGGMLLRLAFEMASSRKAVVCIVAASACYFWSTVVELDIAPVSSPKTARMSQVATLLLGHHLLLFSLVNYARQVVLEAMGLVESPAIRRAKLRTAKAEKVAARQAKLETKKASAATRTNQTAAKATANSASGTNTKTGEPQVARRTAPKLCAVSPDSEDLATTQNREETQAAKPNLKAVHVEQDSYEEEVSKMSKAERRRLRKLEKRQQRRAG